MFILGFPVPVYNTVCVPRPFILAAVWSKHGTSSERDASVFRARRVLARIFTPCSSTVRACVHPEDFTPRPFKLTVVWV